MWGKRNKKRNKKKHKIKKKIRTKNNLKKKYGLQVNNITSGQIQKPKLPQKFSTHTHTSTYINQVKSKMRAYSSRNEEKVQKLWYSYLY